MVQRALSHRRSSNRTLEIDVSSAAAVPTTTPGSTASYVTIPIRVSSVRGRSESTLPLSRHHLSRRSDSVSTTTSSVSSSYRETRYLNRENMMEEAVVDDEVVKREGEGVN